MSSTPHSTHFADTLPPTPKSPTDSIRDSPMNFSSSQESDSFSLPSPIQIQSSLNEARKGILLASNSLSTSSDPTVVHKHLHEALVAVNSAARQVTNEMNTVSKALMSLRMQRAELVGINSEMKRQLTRLTSSGFLSGDSSPTALYKSRHSTTTPSSPAADPSARLSYKQDVPLERLPSATSVPPRSARTETPPRTGPLHGSPDANTENDTAAPRRPLSSPTTALSHQFQASSPAAGSTSPASSDARPAQQAVVMEPVHTTEAPATAEPPSENKTPAAEEQTPAASHIVVEQEKNAADVTPIKQPADSKPAAEEKKPSESKPVADVKPTKETKQPADSKPNEQEEKKEKKMPSSSQPTQQGKQPAVDSQPAAEEKMPSDSQPPQQQQQQQQNDRPTDTKSSTPVPTTTGSSSAAAPAQPSVDEVLQQRQLSSAKTDASIAEYVKLLETGSLMSKYNVGNTNVDKRFFRLDTQKQTVSWWRSTKATGRADVTIALSELKWIVYGPYTQSFRKHDSKIKTRTSEPWNCFSMVTPSRTVDLQAPDEKTCKAWVLGLQSLVLASQIQNDRPVLTPARMNLKKLRMKVAAKESGQSFAEMVVTAVLQQDENATKQAAKQAESWEV